MRARISRRMAGRARRRQHACAAHASRQPPASHRARRCLSQFAAAGIDARCPRAKRGIIVDPPMNVRALPGFDAGAFSVQDLGAQLAAPLLAPLPGQRVLDACAAPGGKTTHLLELADIDLVALDSDGDRACARPRKPRAARASTSAASQVVAGRRRRAASVVGRPAVRSHPGRCPVHRGGRRSPSSRHQMAAAGSRHRKLRAAAGAPPRRAVGMPRARRRAPVRDVLDLRGGKRGAGRGVSRATCRMRCAKPSPFPRRRRGAARNSCLRSPARATIKTDISTRSCASLEGHRPQRVFRPPADADGLIFHRRRAPRLARRNAPSDSIPLPCARLRSNALGRGLAARAAGARRCSSRRRRGARRHDRRQVGGDAGRRGRVCGERGVRPRVQPDARGSDPEGRAALLRVRVRAPAPALVLGGRKGAVVVDAVPRLLQRDHAAIPRGDRPPRARRSTGWTRSSASCRASPRGRSRRSTSS